MLFRSADDIRWANVIFVMEEKHKSQLVAEFSRMIEGERIHVLELPNVYKYVGPELVEQLEPSVAAILGSGLNSFITKARPHKG